VIRTYDDYENACNVIDDCPCNPDCDKCKQGIEATEDFEGLILTAALHGDMDAISKAGGAKPRTLLTWSDPDFDGDIRTGNYIIRRCTMSVTGVMTTLYRAMTSNLEPISRHVSLDYAKLACENHARKMLGWEV